MPYCTKISNDNEDLKCGHFSTTANEKMIEYNTSKFKRYKKPNRN